MNFRIRRLIFWSFIIAFFLLSPFIIFYTAGYRISEDGSLRIIKTGTLILSSTPRQASIILNGTDSGKVTPTIIKGLTPGRYEVTLTKKGYLPWKKRITVQENNATFVSDVRLFKDTAPVELLNKTNLSLWSKPRGTQILVIAKSNEAPHSFELSLLAKNPAAPIVPLASLDGDSLTPMDWSEDETRIIIQLDKEWVLLNLATHQTTTLSSSEILAGTFALHYSDNGLLYAATPKQIYLLEKQASKFVPRPVNQSASASTVTGHIDDFWIANSKLYEAVSLNEGSSLLRVSKLGSLNTASVALVDSGTYHYLDSDATTLLLTHNSDVLIYDISSLAPTLRTTIAGSMEAVIADTGAILYTRGFELQRYSAATNSHTLLVRTTTPLTSIGWLPGSQYALFSTNNNVYAIDTEGPELYTSWLLLHYDALQGYASTVDGSILYFAGQMPDGTSGLFERSL
ncbi:hypothetical protein COV04_02770 [Candidatus Uhrbacteria bacterium CG10_big_fil_rev_8_21_14_0_10_48_11]|uniref:PEGA domain-containing protein n=1 Tax=Candidatus Uhrbacteria bacterium CG10_big_fil_rev_8_21_14_0_10_48_11 TaxID=1975037 RepID=A0A2M8LEH5_9BACT|nr:MAG: hypothetical protein COV04_02770 [Candidatus Uhrbacteria bacterium CG10_big_fil_rev_8_21_14_0_10_48_11]